MSVENCKLQLRYSKIGPIRIGAKVSLTDEFGKSSYYHVVPWFMQNKKKLAGFICLTTVAAYQLVKAAKQLMESIMVLPPTQQTIVAGLAFLLVGIGLITTGPAKFRAIQKLSQKTRDTIPDKQFFISKTEYLDLKSVMNKTIKVKNHFYNGYFRNCNMLSRGLFHELKKHVLTSRKATI